MLDKISTNKIIKSHRKFFVFLLFFIYSLGVGVAIQCYIAPNLFPQLDQGDGIITMDSNGFNLIAKAKSKEIRENGWRAWELRPRNQSPAGIASVFYALLIPKPYVLLPYNALLHALSGYLILCLLLIFFPWKPALFGSILFVVNPAAMYWVSQIHRDGLFILGNLMVLTCFVQFWLGLRSADVRGLSWGFMFGMVGLLLVWIARMYWVKILFVFSVSSAMLIGIFYWIKRGSLEKFKYQGFLFVFLFITLLLYQGVLLKYQGAGFNKSMPASVKPTPASVKSTPGNMEASSHLWEKSRWVPDFIEKQMYNFSIGRRGAIRSLGNTLVDNGEYLNSVESFIFYLPRAVQIGLFSPFPDLWTGQGSTPVMTLARKITGVTTLFYYFCLFGLLVGIIVHRNNEVLWFILLFSFLGILMFAYVYPNIGALLRFRYGFYMLLISFGGANIVDIASQWRRKLSSDRPVG